MSPLIKKATLGNLWFWILSGFAIALITAGFLTPPTGVIDGSVLTAVGEVFAFAALGAVILAIEKGLPAKVQHNNTSFTVGDDKHPREEHR
ncbi:MAG: hypothetical protein IKI66_10375 [Bacteroidales bacterium]|nr:hypothetical protein [Bacteroidales bacterium]